MVELYGDAEFARMGRRIARWRAALLLLAAAGLAACLAMIARTGTANAARMEQAVIVVSTVVGWLVLYGFLFVVAVGQRERRHAGMLRAEAREAVRGVVTVTDERVSIRRSITARRVEVRGAEETRRLLVCETRAAELANAGATTLYAVHGYVAAYEVSP